MNYYSVLKPLLFRLPPETAHDTAIGALAKGLVPPLPPVTDAQLGIAAFGLGFDSPIGLAAGFDKNAQAFGACFTQGMGFCEVGTLTPQPQPGNPKPRMFRLREDRAIINRLGFNNAGAADTLRRIRQHELERTGILGINIGKNKISNDALADYTLLLREAYEDADYITVNISSPNTPGLRDLQERETFELFIRSLMQERNSMAAFKGYRRPVLVKIAPDMDEDALRHILDSALLYGVDGMIISNTTIARPDALKSSHATEDGGLSGEPLREMSLNMLRTAYRHTHGKLTLIGVGGIMSGADAVSRIRAGASLIQLYTGLVYEGFPLVREIKQTLLKTLAQENLASVQALVGSDH